MPLATIYTANKQASAIRSASAAQVAASDRGIAAQTDAQARVAELLAPYVEAGNKALTGQGDLLGTNGADAQQAAIAALQGSPQFAALTQQGENAMLQNASATGGLRGGNMQSALMEFRPNLLSQLIEQQFGRLGGLSALGQNSAAGVGSGALSTAGNVATLLQQQGAAQAGRSLGVGAAWGAVPGQIISQLGTLAGLGGGLGGAVGGAGFQAPQGFKW